MGWLKMQVSGTWLLLGPLSRVQSYTTSTKPGCLWEWKGLCYYQIRTSGIDHIMTVLGNQRDGHSTSSIAWPFCSTLPYPLSSTASLCLLSLPIQTECNPSMKTSQPG
jgi:hypothetical protein